jgi:PilZ domain
MQYDGNPRVLIADDSKFSGSPLVDILDPRLIDAWVLERGESLQSAIAETTPPYDLLVFPVDCRDEGALLEIRGVRKSLRGRQLPILGVASFCDDALDIPTLRSHGIIGLVDRNAPHEFIVERIEQLVDRVGKSRYCERVPCFFPVRLSNERRAREEFALDLSASGMRTTSAERIDPNTDVEISFQLPMVGEQTIDAKGRVVHRMPKRNSAGRFEIGMFFYEMQPPHRDLIEREVNRLLGS